VLDRRCVRGLLDCTFVLRLVAVLRAEGRDVGESVPTGPTVDGGGVVGVATVVPSLPQAPRARVRRAAGSATIIRRVDADRSLRRMLGPFWVAWPGRVTIQSGEGRRAQIPRRTGRDGVDALVEAGR
jgi:hypothetical protein